MLAPRTVREMPEKNWPSCPAFKVTQGHWNWHGSIDYLWLLISNPSMILSLVLFPRSMASLVKKTIAKFSHPCI